MEFGNFKDLPESDQVYINKILFSAAQTCKEGKRPEFAWIDNVGPRFERPMEREKLASDTTDTSDENTEMARVPQPINVLPPMVPAYGFPIGFAGPPIIGYAPVQNMAIIPTPAVTVYPFAAQTVPVSVATNVTGFAPIHGRTDMCVVEPAVDSDDNFDTMIHQDSKQVNSENSSKQLPRRNKKRRPPGYYEQLEAQQDNSQSDSNFTTSDSTTYNGVQRTMDSEPVYLTANNDMHVISTEAVRTMSQNNSEAYQSSTAIDGRHAVCQPEICQTKNETLQKGHVTNSSVKNEIHYSASLSADNSSQKTSQIIAPQTTSHPEHIITPLSNSQTAQDFTPAKAESEISRNARGALPDEVDRTSEGLPFSTSSQQASEAAPLQSNTNTNQQQTLSQTLDSSAIAHEHSETKDTSGSKPAEEAAAHESAQEACGEAVDSQPAVPEQPKKPASWAGLFSGTKQAQAATVIYTNKKKEVVAVESRDENSSITKAPTVLEVVPVADDKSARSFGEILNGCRLNHKALALVPRGLTNTKNWCYVNATLQALLACPPFFHLLKVMASLQTSDRGPTSTPFTDALVKFTSEFSSMHGRVETQKVLNAKGTMKLDIPQGTTFEPSYVYDVLRLEKYASIFIHGRQEDAEEFLSCVLNGMHEEMVAALSLVRPKPSQQEEASEEKDGDEREEERAGAAGGADDGWEQVGPRNKAVVTRSTDYSVSPISEIFQGQIRSILHQSGMRESATLQPFFTLQLDIQSDKVWSVKDALENLVKKECLQDYTCTKTKQEIDASRRIVLEELPPVLVLHLKYFVYDKSGGSQKLTKHIDYNVDLEISKDFLSPNVRSKLSSNQRRYKLFAVVNHHGARLLGGHYTTYVYHCGVNGWIHIDDEIVRTVQVASMLKHSPPKVPYLLYYRKVDLQ